MQIDRGDEGAQPNPDWTAHFFEMSHCEIDDYIGSHADCGPMRRDQVVAILQHLPPPPAGWISFPSVLDEHAGTVARWDADVARGAVPAHPKPDEVAAWCDHVGVNLPETFVQRLQKNQTKPTRVRQAVKPVKYASWIPLGQPKTTCAPQPKKRGRPRSPINREYELVDSATEIMLEAAHQGTTKSIPDIARILHQQPAFNRWSHARIVRRLNGQLPWETARIIAAKARTSVASARPKTATVYRH